MGGEVKARGVEKRNTALREEGDRPTSKDRERTS